MEFTGTQRQLLDTADAWLQLGDYNSANEELEKLPPELRSHFEVLKLRCKIYRIAKRWPELTQLAFGCAKIYPNVLPFWIEWAWAEHHQGRTKEALELLQSQVDKFPTSANLAYLLACYSSELGRIPEAEKWIQESFVLSVDKQRVKLKALDEPMLKKLWGETRKPSDEL